MGKVSIALRGWRFDEEEVFDEDDQIRPLEEMSEETRERLIRLRVVAGEPCDCCYLLSESKADCNVARIVYGEPLSEVLLCPEHEPDFLYWFREDGGSREKGESHFADVFHEWFAAGNRAPEGYGGMDHVDTEPDRVPAPDMGENVPELEEALEDLDDEDLDVLGTDYSDVT
ncbi:hypothetical protein HWV07_03010 [Natronomonas salina]|uniref:hypothetical protein n=1 Tax=Natronomonas salina TaxID=1710540 RepID=UPI0015B6F900|nr:hypothetical protein [Natronomonas salina]QLD88063.1 hypothetical protein HWV07_03010 [Natronomonas salina]